MLQPLAGGTPFGFLLIGAIAGSLSITIAALGLSRWLRKRYQESIGRRQVQAKKLRLLACGVRAAYVEDVLGPSAFQRKTGDTNVGEESGQERIYVLPDAFVQIHCTEDEVVQSFAITTRNKRFAPNIDIPWGGSKGRGSVRLGRTKYADLNLDLPTDVEAWAAVRHFHYQEAYYLGNPGFYQHYILASNDASGVGWSIKDTSCQSVLLLHTGSSIDPSQPSQDWHEFRRRTAPNTFTVVGPHLDWRLYAQTSGVALDTVRVFPED